MRIRVIKIIGEAMLLLLLLPAIVSAFWLTLTEDGLHWAYYQGSVYMPGEVSFSSLQGRLIGPITINHLEYQIENTEVRAERVKLDWSPLSLLGTRVDISQLHVQALTITRQASSEPQQAPELPNIHLPWQLQIRDVVIDDVHIRQAQQDYYLDQLRLEASSLFDRLSIEILSIKGDTFGLELNGSVTLTKNYPHKLDVRWHGELPSRVMLEGKGRLDGNMDLLKVQQHITGPVNLKLQGELKNLLQQLSWKATVDVSQFNSTRFNPDWPAVKGKLNFKASGNLSTATVIGEARGQQADVEAFEATFKLHRLADNHIKIESLSAYTPATQTRLNISGDWQPPVNGSSISGDVDLNLDWQNLRWPMLQQAWFSSAAGKAKLTGNIKQYYLDLTTDRPRDELPRSSWHILAKGDHRGLDIERLGVQTLDGTITSKGRLDWSKHFSWRASTSAQDINPGLQWSQWPGSLAASLTSHGTIENGNITADVSIKTLQGQLRGNPLSLISRLRWQQDTLTIHQLELTSGKSLVKASGQAGSTLALDWSVMADDIAPWMPQATGSLQANGQLTGSLDEANVKASIKGRELGLHDIEVGSIAGTVAADINRWKQIDIRLSSKALKFRNFALQSLDIVADSGSLQAKIISEPLSAQLRLKGGIIDDSWQGQLEQADIQSLNFADWQLTKPVKLSLGPRSAHVEALCWKSQQARICGDITGEDKTWQSKLSFNRLPLNLFKPWLPAAISIDGLTEGTASFDFNSPDKLSARSQVFFTGGKLSYQLDDGEYDTLEYRHGKIDLALNSKGLQATAELSMSNNDQLQGALSLPGLNPLTLDTQQQALKAELSMNIKDYDILETILPEVRDVQGNMQLKLLAQGTLDQPLLSGQVQLTEATARIPRLGLSIEQINLTGQSDQFEQFNFQLSALSGEGQLNIQGKTLLDKKAGWLTTLQIRGDSVEVSRIPEARVQVSPDLKVKIEHRNVDISGDVLIPYARLQPRDITTAARVSNDVIIIGSDKKPEEKWAISSSVRLTLGDRVNFYGFGFEGRFDGNLLLQDIPGQPTRGTGDIKVAEGRYKAYGQNLEIEHGRLLFTGGPVVNPGLDLRAIRRVNEVTAGLRVKGTLSQPQIELFSIPAMGQTNALSYLLLGRPIENASNDEGSMMAKAALALSLSGGDRLARSLGDRFGLDEMRVESSNNGDQASLVVGRYLSPKLYVSYGVGLIDSFNTLNIRYQLSSKWQLKGESGEAQGADLLYTIER